MRLGTELIVVVLGVLIALWAEGVAEERRARNDLRGELAAVRAELVRAQEQLTFRQRGLEEESAALRRLASLNHGGSEPPLDSLGYFVISAIGTIQEYRPNLAALRDLEASGHIPLIDRVELRRALAGLQEALLQADLMASVNQTGPQRDLFDPFLVQYFPSAIEWAARSDDPSFPMGPHSSDAWDHFRSERGRSLLAFRSSSNSVMAAEWLRLRDRMAAMVTQIDAEIG